MDLGSGSFLRLRKPRVVLAAGDGVSQYGTGTIWHALDFRRRVPCTLVEPADFGDVEWTDDTVLILPSGDYAGVLPDARERLRAWVRGGGTVIAVGSAGRFLKEADILKLTFRGDAPEPDEDAEGEEDDGGGRRRAPPRPRRPVRRCGGRAGVAAGRRGDLHRLPGRDPPAAVGRGGPAAGRCSSTTRCGRTGRRAPTAPR